MPWASTLLALALADCDDITASPSGDLYLSCHSPSDRFTVPVKGGKKANDEMDGYVIRLRKQSHEIVFVTRIGGSAYDSAMRAVADDSGNVWVVGFTQSADFPVTADAWQRLYGGNGDAFLVKLSPMGDVLFSTFVGGAQSDFGNAIVLARGQPIIAGTSGGDAFVASGPSLRARFGGTGEEKLTGMTHHKGKLYAAGYTKSRDWRVLSGPSDAFAVRLDAATLGVEREEYFGGTGDDSAWGIAVGRRGEVYLAGQTNSPDLPGTRRGYQRVNRGGVDAFVARLGGAATYFGGSAKDEAGYDGQNITVDDGGNVWMAGMTYSSDLPAQGTYGGGDGDAFVASFSPALNRLRFASYSGLPTRDLGEGIALIPGGAVITMVRFGAPDGIPVGPFRANSVVSFWHR